MSENTKIEWADHTQNFWEGCQPTGPGCDNCYAEARNKRFGGGVAVNWGPGAPRRRTSEANWRKPFAWNANHDAFFAEHGRRQRVLCSSLSDWADNAVDPQWRVDMFRVIRATPNLDWLLLTKRIGNAHDMMIDVIEHELDMGPDNAFDQMPWPNVWIGATVVDQTEADRDIPKLLAVPAVKHFLSMEPLLGPVDLSKSRALGLYGFGTFEPGVDWVIVGGESGPNARPMHPDWARGLRDQCAAAGVPFLFKQWGEWLPMLGHAEGVPVRGEKFIFPDGTIMGNAGKKAAGRLLDGREWNGVPQ